MRGRLVSAFWNRRSRRPRLPWRLLALVVVLAALAVGASLAAPTLRAALSGALEPVVPADVAGEAAGNVVLVASMAAVSVGAVALVGRFVDRRWLRDFGLHVDRDWWLDLGFGLALGAALMAGVFLVELALGWVVVVGTFRLERAGSAFPPLFGWAVVTFVVVGVTEELLTRGYLLTNLAEGLTWFDRLDEFDAVGLAVLGSSLAFAAGHAANPSASLASTLGIAVASVMLAAGYVLTGELAIPIGIHVTWNLVQGPVFGFPVSGLDLGLSVLAIEQRGPRVATGGAFGPEAGLLGVAASLVGIGLVLAWVRRREGRLRIAPSLSRPALRTG